MPNEPAWGFWLDEPYWTVEQAVALLQGEEPNPNSLIVDRRLQNDLLFAIKLKDVRAYDTGERSRFGLGDNRLGGENDIRVVPLSVVQWASAKGYRLPGRLVQWISDLKEYDEGFEDDEAGWVEENIRTAKRDLDRSDLTPEKRAWTEAFLRENITRHLKHLIDEDERAISFWERTFEQGGQGLENARYQLDVHKKRLADSKEKLSELAEEEQLVAPPVPEPGGENAPKTARKKKRAEISQKDAAKLCGVSPRTIQNWESGKATPDGYPGRMSALHFRIWVNNREHERKLKDATRAINKAPNASSLMGSPRGAASEDQDYPVDRVSTGDDTPW